MCQIHIADIDTKEPVYFSQVFGRLGALIKKDSSSFILSCSYSDSLLVEATGYESKMIKYHQGIDTVFLKMNEFLLEPVLISSKKHKSKKYYLGKRNNRCRRYTSYGLEFHQGQTFLSFIPNNLDRDFKIIEGYIFLQKNILEMGDTIPLQLKIQLYEVVGDTIGAPLSEEIFVIDQDIDKGWFQLKIDKYLNFPKEGLCISIQGFHNVDNYISLGLMEYKEESGFDSFISFKNKWYLYPFDINGQDLNVGVKMYFKVKK